VRALSHHRYRLTPMSSRRKPNELRALSAMAFEELARFPHAIRDTHLGIAERAFNGVGPAAAPVKLLHDALSSGAYGAVGAGVSLLGRATDSAIEQRGIGERLELSSSPRGSGVIAALNGLRGDRLQREHSELHQPASVRVDGERVVLADAALREAFPRATGRVVVFLHGLMETEFSWSWGARARDDTYGARLERELDSSAVYVRYNSGLHISENGRAIAELLEQLVHAWPVKVAQVALVGHSMGGLVARSACHQAAADGQHWVRRVRHVVTLGTPHLGAPLEQGAHRAAAALQRLPETRMLASLLRQRSAGIRDLRHGSLVDEDWRGRDPDALIDLAVREVPLLAGATHCFVAATITRDASHPLGRLLGDVLVLPGSASGTSRTRRIGFRDEHGLHLGGAHHFALLNHPEVYERLREWLAASHSDAEPEATGADRALGAAELTGRR
jgi:pimeloyl-ACP methyl ester carboxylesterase